MADIRRYPLRSWLCPESSRALSLQLRDELIKRFQGRRGLFITLTLDRKHDDDPLSAYRRASRERLVRKFIEDLGWWLFQRLPVEERQWTDSGYWKNPLTAKWIRKLEFQMEGEEGWPHWHLVIEWPSRIPHAVLTRLWGEGHVDVRLVNPRRLGYFAKYVAKADEVPGWLLMERPKSVKIIASSPGFWDREQKARSGAGEKKVPPQMYVCIGGRLDELRSAVTVRDRITRQHRSFRVPLGRALARLRCEGGAISGDAEGRWLRVRMPFEVACAVLEDEEAAGEAGEAGEPADLYLIKRRNPPFYESFFRSIGELVWRDAA